MKIDIHVHTKKIKRGDPPSREITPEKLTEIVLSTDVKIIAITNHNMFDLEQFDQIVTNIDGAIQVWPGIELDVLENGQRGHLIVIVSPNSKASFYKSVREAILESDPNDFTMSIDAIIHHFDKLEPIYIAHYLQKKPDITDEVINKLSQLCQNKKRIIKEAANSISAGIFIAHGHISIYGSDIQNWENYSMEASKLPELRLPVDSFEQFCLLLEKNESAINTALSRKENDFLSLKPFGDDTIVVLKPFNDINVIFGPKGTGKTKILEAIAKHYSNIGIRTTLFTAASDMLSEKYDLKGKNITKNLNAHGINYCTDEIQRIKSSQEIDVTSTLMYREYFLTEKKSKNSKKIKIKDLPVLNESKFKTSFNEFEKASAEINKIIDFLTTNGPIKETATQENIQNLEYQLSELANKLKNRMWDHFASWKSTLMTNNASKLFREEDSRKTGTLTKPNETGFRRYVRNRLSIKSDALEVLKNASYLFPDDVEFIGTLGPEKGELHCATSYQFNDGTKRDSRYISIKGIKKGNQTHFSKCIRNIIENAFSDKLFDNIRELNEIEGIEAIETVYELLTFYRRFTINNEEYTPSTGECSMLNLQGELSEDKDIYILDEPEKSLGNEYINDVIIPLVKEKARQGKKVFISTHDANIAVRTLPYNSIYRCHNRDGYSTYVGNPFTNNLVGLNNPEIKLDWKKISMKTLEGGETAFGERGKIYENH